MANVNGELEVTGDVGISGASGMGVESGSKLFLDGADLAGDTYIYESAANTISFYTNGSSGLSISSSLVLTGSARDLGITAAKKLFLDGGGDTYIYESAANIINMYAGGVQMLTLTGGSTLVSVGSTVDLAVAATKKIFLDGGANTYIYESSADVVNIYTGGSSALQLSTSLVLIGSRDFSVASTKKIYLDGSGDTYIYESAANTIDIYTGGTRRITFSSVGIANDLSFDTDLLYVDATNDRIYIGESSGVILAAGLVYSKAQILVTTGLPALSLVSTWSGNSGPDLYLYHKSASPANNDGVGAIYFYGLDSDLNDTIYGSIRAYSEVVTAGSEEGSIIFNIFNTTYIQKMKISGNGVTCNNGSFFAPDHSTTASAANCFIDSSTGEIKRSTSSKKYKKEITNLDFDVSLLNKMRPVSYISKSDSKKYLGLISEELVQICPELVEFNKDNKPEGIQYGHLTAPLILGWQNHDKKIQELEEKLKTLDKKLKELAKK